MQGFLFQFSVPSSQFGEVNESPTDYSMPSVMRLEMRKGFTANRELGTENCFFIRRQLWKVLAKCLNSWN